MPKILDNKATAKTIALYDHQLDKINLVLGREGGTLTEFVRTAVQEKLDRLDSIEESDPFGLKGVNKNSILIHSDIYQEWFGIGKSSFSHKKRNGKIKVHNKGGQQWVEVREKETSFILKFLNFEDKAKSEISSLRDMLREYMEKAKGLEIALQNVRTEVEELKKAK